MRFQKCTLAAMFLVALLAMSCSSKKQMLGQKVENNMMQTDSVHLIVRQTMTPMVIPKRTAVLTLSADSLAQLPIGAMFQIQNEHARATVTNQLFGYEFRADCDSLSILVNELQTEIYHSKKEITDLKSETKEQTIIEVNRLTGWQNFQLYIGRLILILLACYLVFKAIKKRI